MGWKERIAKMMIHSAIYCKAAAALTDHRLITASAQHNCTQKLMGALKDVMQTEGRKRSEEVLLEGRGWAAVAVWGVSCGPHQGHPKSIA